MIWSILFISVSLTFAYESPHPDYLSQLRASGQDEEYARLLGVDDVNLIRQSTERSEDFDMISKPVSPLGDIMLTKEQSEQVRQNIRFSKHPSMQWEKNTIYYSIEPNDFTNSDMMWIHKCIEEMNMNMTYAKIMKYPDHFNPKNSVRVVSASGCWSYLGQRGGTQPLSLQRYGCMNKATIQHEFVHAFGFTHEHNRHDRDDHIGMNWGNIPEVWQSQFIKVDNDDFEHEHPYDYYSVMHYPISARGIYENAFSVKQTGIDEERIGKQDCTDCMTDSDIRRIDDIYKTRHQ